MDIPRRYGWNIGDPGMQRSGMQNQRFVKVLDHGNAQGSPNCKIIILMDEGHASDVHIHYLNWIYVDVIECGHQGVLTLAGDRLQHEIWNHRYTTLAIPPGVPHVTLYPHQPAEARTLPDFEPVQLRAIETRTTSSATADTVALDDYGPLLAQRVKELGLDGWITPNAQMLGRSRPAAESSCFPANPTRHEGP
jgi:hypothetical protein